MRPAISLREGAGRTTREVPSFFCQLSLVPDCQPSSRTSFAGKVTWFFPVMVVIMDNKYIKEFIFVKESEGKLTAPFLVRASRHTRNFTADSAKTRGGSDEDQIFQLEFEQKAIMVALWLLSL